MIRLANYASAGRYPRPYVAISSGIPVGFSIDDRCWPLVPPWKEVERLKKHSIPWETFADRYWDQLSDLWENRREVFGELDIRGGSTLLCWERAGVRCHRRVLACFLLKVGFEVQLDGQSLPADWEDF